VFRELTCSTKTLGFQDATSSTSAWFSECPETKNVPGSSAARSANSGRSSGGVLSASDASARCAAPVVAMYLRAGESAECHARDRKTAH